MTPSPIAPAGRRRPASSMIATSGPAAGPTVPGLRGAGGSGLLVIWWVASLKFFAWLAEAGEELERVEARGAEHAGPGGERGGGGREGGREGKEGGVEGG